MNYNGTFLLQCVLKYSANKNCVESARKLLLALMKGDEEAYSRQYGYAGDFMKACADGDFFTAYRRADPLNATALELGIKDFFKTPYIWGELPKMKDLGGIPE